MAMAPWPLAPALAGDPSPAYREGLKRTAELRKVRRVARPGQPVGLIVPYPMPPALVIRHTAESHDEIQALLDALRR
jgi:hypothetical protein